MANGYTYEPSRDKYSVRVTVDGKRKFIGRYDTAEEAHQAYLDNSPSRLEDFPIVYEESKIHRSSIISWIKAYGKVRAVIKANKAKRLVAKIQDDLVETQIRNF